MAWKAALDDLQASVSTSVSRLRDALEQYESAIQRRREELEVLQRIDAQLVRYAFNVEEVMTLIVECGRTLTGASFCDLLLPDREGNLEVAWSSLPELLHVRVPIDGSVTGEAYSGGNSVLVPDVSKHPSYHKTDGIDMGSELAVPMKDEFGGVVGVINLEFAAVEHFTPHHDHLIRTLAGQAAIALRNTRLYKQFMSVLETFNLIRSESESLQRILSIVGEQAREMVGAEQCQVLTCFGDELVVAYTTGQEEPGVTRLKVKGSVSGLAVTRKEVVRYDDITLDEEARQNYKDVLGGMRSEIALPIISKDHDVIGVINLESPRPSAFTMHHEKLLQLYAVQAAVAISNAKRMQELFWNRQVQAELWTMAQIGDAYGPFIHRLNSDAGAISALLSEIRFKHDSLVRNNADLNQLLQGIERKAERILEVPGKLKRKIESVVSYKQVDIVEIIQNILGRIEAHPQIIFKKELKAVPRIWAPSQVEEIIDILVKNAVEALPNGGIVVIGTRDWVTRTRTGDESVSGIEVYFKDTCGGIPPETIPLIWEFGSTTKDSIKKQNMGFGLWWLKAFVERLGGAVTVEPRVSVGGQDGCQFNVKLPFKAREPFETESLGIK